MTPVLVAEFETGRALIAGVRVLRDAGVSKLDAFTPYEVHGLEDALGVRRSWLGWIVLAAGLTGAGAAYLLQWWINVIDYPLNIGGRPYHSWPSFIPITFEMGVLSAATAALVSALVLGGLPRLWSPIFEVDGFDRATLDRFWLAVDRGDPELDPVRDVQALTSAGALRVMWLGGAS